jgi:hypothetical protein
MKKILKIIGILAGLVILAVIVITMLTPWMDRWGATDEEIAASVPGDELLPEPASFVNRAITVNAPPEYIYPWIVQLDARKGGWYSYTGLETHLLNCPMVNADRIHEEWQDLKVGDEVRMCPNEPAPPPYIVAQIHPDQAIVLGHQENGNGSTIPVHHRAAGGWQLPVDPAHPHYGGWRILDNHSSRNLHHGTRHVIWDQGTRRTSGADQGPATD